MVTYGSYDTYDTTGTGDTWRSWVTADMGATTTNGTVTAWTMWSRGTYSADSSTTFKTSSYNGYVPFERTPEEIEQYQTHLEAQRKAIEERERKAAIEREEAKRRADRLLLSLLNRRQRKEYRDHGRITLFREGTRYPHYVLEKSQVNNIIEHDQRGKPIKRHCVHPSNVPLADMLAAQYLYLMSDPTEMFQKANSHLI